VIAPLGFPSWKVITFWPNSPPEMATMVLFSGVMMATYI
jgi:hypothetical protein